MNNIGARIRYYRIYNNLTQQDLGDKLGLSHASISHFETGRTLPNLFDIEKMCKIFDIPSQNLLENYIIKDDTSNENFSTKNIKLTKSMINQRLTEECNKLIKEIHSILQPNDDDVIHISISRFNHNCPSTDHNISTFYSSYLSQLEKQIKKQQNIIEKNYKKINALETKLNKHNKETFK